MSDHLNVCAKCLTTFREGDTTCTNCGENVKPHQSLSSLLTTADVIRVREGAQGNSEEMMTKLRRPSETRLGPVCQITNQKQVSGYDPSVAADAPDPDQVIVGHCPKCGAPIYGKPTISKQDVPSVKYTCICRSAEQRSVMRHS